MDLFGQNQINAVSCASISLCVAGTSRGWVLTSTDPTGGASAWNVAGTAAPTAVPWFNWGSLTCPGASLCVGASSAADGSSTSILTSTDPAGGGPTWTSSVTLPHVSAVFAMSCPSVSLCIASGVVSATGNLVILSSTDPAGGAADWKVTPLPIPNARYMPLSCPTKSLCIGVDPHGMVSSTDPAGGSSAWQTTYGAVPYAFVMSCANQYLCVAGLGSINTGGIAIGTSPIPTATTLHLSARSIRYGHERTEHVSVTVHPRLAEVITGTVTITAGTKTICHIRLHRGTGSCALSWHQLKRGTYKLRARYSGSTYLDGSTSPTARLVIVR